MEQGLKLLLHVPLCLLSIPAAAPGAAAFLGCSAPAEDGNTSSPGPAGALEELLGVRAVLRAPARPGEKQPAPAALGQLHPPKSSTS